VNDSALKATAPSITARPTLEEKRLFSAIAAKRQNAGTDRHSRVARFGRTRLAG
jgi:hypothetical protein